MYLAHTWKSGTIKIAYNSIMISILKDIYSHCNEMQKLADTKNTGLIAFNGAIIIGVTKLAIDFSTQPILFGWFCYIILLSLISIFLNLSALVAQLKHIEKNTLSYASDNPLFFGRVSQLTSDQLVETLRNRYKIEEDTGQYEIDLAKQAIVMAQIATRKFKLFNRAFFWTISAIATPIGALVFESYFNPNK